MPPGTSAEAHGRPRSLRLKSFIGRRRVSGTSSPLARRRRPRRTSWLPFCPQERVRRHGRDPSMTPRHSRRSRAAVARNAALAPCRCFKSATPPCLGRCLPSGSRGLGQSRTRPENPRVGGSIPPPGTPKHIGTRNFEDLDEPSKCPDASRVVWESASSWALVPKIVPTQTVRGRQPSELGRGGSGSPTCSAGGTAVSTGRPRLSLKPGSPPARSGRAGRRPRPASSRRFAGDLSARSRSIFASSHASAWSGRPTSCRSARTLTAALRAGSVRGRTRRPPRSRRRFPSPRILRSSRSTSRAT